MQLTKEFINKTVIEIKNEKDKLRKEFNLKLDLLHSTINSNIHMLEHALKQNFPMLNSMLPPLITSSINNIPNLLETSYILKGEDEVSKEFKRHIEFLKLVDSSPEQANKFHSDINHYFNYWTEEYYEQEYRHLGMSEEGKTQYPNIFLALERVSFVIGYNTKLTLNISHQEDYNLNASNWLYNEPVEFKYNHNTHVYELKLGNGLICNANSSDIQHCPDIDVSVSNVINTEFKEKLGFDYNTFMTVNDKFNKFIIRLSKYFTFDHIELTNLYDKIKQKHTYSPIVILNTEDLRVTVRPGVVDILFKFKNENGQYDNKYLEIKIDNSKSTLDLITSKFNTTQQSTRFIVKDDENITLYGYSKNHGSKESHLHYYTEEYKLSVLYYGQKLLNEEELIFNSINIRVLEMIEEKRVEDIANTQ